MLIALAAGVWLLTASGTDEECLACHGDRDTVKGAARDVYVDAARHAKGVHHDLGCTGCHEEIKDYPHPEKVAKVDCAGCHADEAADLAKSVHASAGGKPDRPACASCHGPAHDILPSSEAASRVAKVNLAATCGDCHANPDFLERHRIPFARPVEAYKLSVHGRAVARGDTRAPACSNCHGSHGILPARDPASRINHWKVPETCGACHAEIRTTYEASIHGQAVSHGVSGAPVCTSCHGEHSILAPSEAGSLVNPARVSTVTCGRCHADERLAEKYNLPQDKVPAYADSYHGLALRSGSQTVANCASCHGVHNILPSSDPRSTVHPTQLSKTCGACHQGAGARFTIGPVHVRPSTRTEHATVRWVRVLYVFVLIPLTLGFMLLHNSVDFLAKLRRGRTHHASGEELPRMNVRFRIAHGLVVLSFTTLVATGFALKFPEAFWAAPLLQWESHFALRGWVHRMAGFVLLGSLAYHAVHLWLVPRDRVILRHLRPRLKDALDLWGMLRFNVGLSHAAPTFGKFSYAEKLEYWAFLWGTGVMGLSGLLLSFNNFTLRHFPTWVADASTAIHYYEAILAALSILVWHFYMVIFDPDVYPMDKAWLSGMASADHLRRSRPAYAAELAPKPPTEATGSDDGSPSGSG